jgi:hypothetical protein
MKWGASLSRMRPKCPILAVLGMQACGFYESTVKAASCASRIYLSDSYKGNKMKWNSFALIKFKTRNKSLSIRSIVF